MSFLSSIPRKGSSCLNSSLAVLFALAVSTPPVYGGDHESEAAQSSQVVVLHMVPDKRPPVGYLFGQKPFEKEIVDTLWAEVQRYSGMEKAPERSQIQIRVVTQEQLVAIVCPDDPQNCRGILAYSDFDRNIVYLSNKLDLNDPDHQSFLGHEMTHFVQQKNGKLAYDGCEDYARTESQAYAVQNALRKKFGLWPVPSLEGFTCNGRELETVAVDPLPKVVPGFTGNPLMSKLNFGN